MPTTLTYTVPVPVYSVRGRLVEAPDFDQLLGSGNPVFVGTRPRRCSPRVLLKVGDGDDPPEIVFELLCPGGIVRFFPYLYAEDDAEWVRLRPRLLADAQPGVWLRPPPDLEDQIILASQTFIYNILERIGADYDNQADQIG